MSEDPEKMRTAVHVIYMNFPLFPCERRPYVARTTSSPRPPSRPPSHLPLTPADLDNLGQAHLVHFHFRLSQAPAVKQSSPSVLPHIAAIWQPFSPFSHVFIVILDNVFVLYIFPITSIRQLISAGLHPHET
jgi:hypothetical protein